MMFRNIFACTYFLNLLNGYNKFFQNFFKHFYGCSYKFQENTKNFTRNFRKKFDKLGKNLKFWGDFKETEVEDDRGLWPKKLKVSNTTKHLT